MRAKSRRFTVSGEKGFGAALGDFKYVMKLVSFLNARHHVTFEQNVGPLHAHSWQFQVEVKVPRERALVEFARVSKAINAVLAPYENTVLNQRHPFNRIQPSTENMALYFFNRLQDALRELGLDLSRLTVWETPTKGIEVTGRWTEFDGLPVAAETAGEAPVSFEEAAAAADAAVAPAEPEEPEGENAAAAPQDLLPEVPEAPAGISPRHYVLSVFLIGLLALLVYHSILSPPAEQRYPWGSDTWGHLFKAEYLYQELRRGNFYPQFTEYWYSGCQPFRYWAPLPYYLLAFLRGLTGDVFTAGNYFIFLCALLGGLSWLLLAGRMGFWPAAAAGAVWVVWGDNLRVAFAEGNLPRVLATALLPLLFAAFLRVVEKRNAYAGIVATAALMHLVVVCHAMIGAVYCLSLVLFTLFLWAFRGCRLKDCLRGVLVLAGGVGTAAWWLLPGLTGGITGINAEAARAAVEFVPAAISFNPLHRFTSPEAFYWGISLLLAAAATLVSWRAKPPWAKSLFVCGLILVLITLPSLRPLYLISPLGNLLWPLRFSSFAALALVAACFTFQPRSPGPRLLRFPRAGRLLVAGLLVAFLVDGFFSVRLLAHTTAKSPALVQGAEFLKADPGWRVAAIDLSRLGSAPSFLLSRVAGVEQVFGWAWQGAVTSTNIMLLNTGLEYQYYPFLFRSCLYLGATDLVVKDDVIRDPEAFRCAAERAGYTQQAAFDGISIWRGFDRPYLVAKENRCLVVGKYAGTVALQFPEVEMGSSIYIDDYTLDLLKRYPRVIFTGAAWRSKKKAEALVTAYAGSGGRVLIELAGMPESVLARQPEFLGVYGEAVMLKESLVLSDGGREFYLQPFSPAVPLWKSYIPQELDGVALEFRYYGNRAPVYGYKRVGDSRVWFLGGNLTYHAFLTRDPAALELLQDITGLQTEFTAGPLVPLSGYRATDRGYVMNCEVSRDLEVIVPVAALDGLRVTVDGVPKTARRFENLLQLELSAGSHEIAIRVVETPVYRWGRVVAFISLLGVLAGVLYSAKRGGGWR